MEELVEDSFCHYYLGRKYTEMSGGLWVSASIGYVFCISENTAKQLKFFCPGGQTEVQFLPALLHRPKLSMTSVKVHWIFHHPIIYLQKDQLVVYHSAALEKSNVSCS